MDQEQRYIIDRIGEETDLENCSLCHAASCFSCVQGFCTALEKVADGGCVFYKDAEENHREIRRCFYRLVWHEDCIGDNPVAVHVRHIREKIEINPAEPRYLKVIWGKGYKMESEKQ